MTNHSQPGDAAGGPRDATRDRARIPTPVVPGALTNGDLTTPMELRDFMHELGVVMQLPHRPTTTAIAAVPDAAPRRPRLARRAVVLPAIAAVLGVAVLGQRYLVPTPPAEVPAVLRGEWQSPHAEYRTRRLSFNATHVGIALRSDAEPALHRVREVRATTKHDTTIVELRYEQDGGLVAFHLRYVAQPLPRLLLRQPAEVTWERVPAAVPGPASAPSPGRAPAPAGEGEVGGTPATSQEASGAGATGQTTTQDRAPGM